MSQNTIQQSEFRKRRNDLMSFNADGATIIAANHNFQRNNDVNYEFRQQSDFWYFTGFEEPDSIIVMLPNNEQSYVMFATPFDETYAIWNGPMTGLDGIQNDYEVDIAYPINELATKLPELLKRYNKLYFSLGNDKNLDELISNLVANRRVNAVRDGNYITNITDAKPTIDKMRLVKSQSEIHMLKTAIETTHIGFNRAINVTQPGKYEYEIQAALENEFRTAGSIRNGYPSIVASGNNSCILHYTKNDCKLTSGDLLLIDAGAELDYYTADITRTWPINGKFSVPQKEIYSLVLNAQLNAISKIKPNETIDLVNQTAINVLTEGLIDLGLLKGNITDLIEQKAYRQYYMHGTSHWLGLDVHDSGVYSQNKTFTKLKPGMVLTVEPGLYFSKYNDNVPEELKGIGIRIEDNILVTGNGHANLSKEIPKEIDSIESLVGAVTK